MINSTISTRQNVGLRFKIIIVWLGIILLASFWLTVKGSSDPVSMTVVPQVPRQGEPVLVTFTLNNPTSQIAATSYKFFANGKLLKEGLTNILPGSGKTYKYAYTDPVPLGQQINFDVTTQSNQGNYEQSISTPPYPPAIWSSFISFASFSTTIMGFMSTMTYYNGSFGITNVGLTVGLLFTIILAGLLIFMELSQPLLANKNLLVMGNLRLRFSTVTWILFMIFIGIVYTKVVMTIAGG
jgi:hypothetical protein